MRRFYFLLVLLMPLLSPAQSISPQRVAKLKASTVQVSVEGSLQTGSGFFISASGEILTCWHIIEPALKLDSASGRVIFKKIYIRFADGEKQEVIIPEVFYNKLYLNAVQADYCLLTPVKTLTKNFSWFKLGDLTKINEGQELYSCSYPVNTAIPFISKGILSNKFIDSSAYIMIGSTKQPIKREAALLDMVMNAGQSGAPVIVFGATPEEDEVIGIANFLLSPYGYSLDKLSSTYADEKINDNDAMMAALSNSVKQFAEVFGNSTTGISACLSINVFLRDVRVLKK